MVKVILKFENFEKRDEWIKMRRAFATQIYTANPWVSADLSSDHIEELKARSDVQVFPDVRLNPT